MEVLFLLLEDDLESTANTKGFRVERITFLECDLRRVSSANNSLTTESTDGSGERCKIEPLSPSKSLSHQELN